MKLVIDIPEDLYKWIKDKYDNPNGEVAYSAIKNGIPYEAEGDLISREALLKALKSNCKPEICHDYGTNWCEACCPHNDFEDLIDNAPTVETEEVAKLKRENTALEQEMLYCRENWKKAERPQGEWIKWNFKTFGAMGDWEYKCSNCEKVYGGEYNFCPNCGADMRGDKE